MMRWGLFCLLVAIGCERGSPRAPRPTAVEPAVVQEGQSVPVTIRGTDFSVASSVSFSSNEIEVNRGFVARLGDTELVEVRYVDSETLTASVPGTLAVGLHDLIVVDPEGREGALEQAFTVEESVVVICERDDQCDDRDVCNGLETCPDGTCVQGVDLDCDDSNPCTTDSCDPIGGCANVGDSDQDDDGYDAIACGGDDCDDDPATCGSACNPGVASDLCDGFNNDCDLDTDEDHVETATSCGQGACAGNAGVMACVGGVPTDTCDPMAGATADDDCDDTDDDCDGTPDDDWVDSASSCGVGECAGNTGTVTCSGGVTSDSCDPYAGAGTEGPPADPTCSDGIDNDCDGPSDAADSGCNAASNLPPLAVATVTPPIGTTGVTTFVADAAGTTDDVDAPAALTYQWDWEDDGTFDDAGASASYTYPTAGTYTVVLRVTDTGGLVDYAVFIVVVTDPSDRILVTTELDEADGGATPASPGGTGLSLSEAIQYANGLGSGAIDVPSGMVILLTGAPPSPVNVDIVADGASIDGGNQGACIDNATNSVIAGFELYDCVVGVRIGTGSQVTRLFVHDTSTGVEAATGTLVGPDNELTGTGTGVLSTGAPEIWRNRIHDNSDSGVDHRNGSAGARIWQNVIWNNDYGIWLGTQSDQAQVIHNTVVANLNDGMFTSNNGTNLDVRNNIFTGNGGWGVFGNDSRFDFLDYNAYYQNTGGACGNCTPGANHTTDDPLFVNPGSADYRLHPDSTLIDAGLDLGLDVNDHEPSTFNGTAPDIGAYEAP